MEKNMTTFVDPMDKLFAPPPDRTRWQSFKLFIYNPETGAFMGRTALNWAQLTVFYIIFYACLAGFWALCMWGLLQSISDDRPTYQLDDSIIGTSPGLTPRPVGPEGRESSITFNVTNRTWSNSEWPHLLSDFLKEYEDSSTGNNCSFDSENQLPCKVNSADWGECAPRDEKPGGTCLYFRINKVLEWVPQYYPDVNNLPSGMPKDLQDKIEVATNKKQVWLWCEGRHMADTKNIGVISMHPGYGFPGYYFPFRRQTNYKSPVVAVHFKDPALRTNIDVECRAWAPNINQDRKEQLGVINLKLKFDE